jgi:hypothetical protein
MVSDPRRLVFETQPTFVYINRPFSTVIFCIVKYGSFHETAEVVNSLQVSNRRYDEMQADFALVPLTISGMSQEEAL